MGEWAYRDGGEGAIDRLQEIEEIDVEALLERSRMSARQRLRRELERIQAQLDEREDIHEQIVSELEWKVDQYTSRLEDLYNRRQGTGGKRERLQDRIVSFYEELREEARSHWQDRQKLERERREILRQLQELEEDVSEDYML